MLVLMIFIYFAEMIQKNVVRNKTNTTSTSNNKHSHIIRDISENEFNCHFANIDNRINSKLQNFNNDIFLESINSVRFAGISD